MRIIVSDSSCLIDLRKASLLEAFLRLPYEIAIPDTLFEEELLKFTAEEKAMLRNNVVELPGAGVRRAQQLVARFPALTIHDGYAFALAESLPNAILLSGDKDLRKIARNHHIEIRGTLWILDEMHKVSVASIADLIATLELFDHNPAVFRLPARELSAMLQRFRLLND